ncbi:MAG: hypothetical protein KDK70_23515 [Myxococcales bacterium]|nr:hypothetical protein [Myxococcales bacterium]
MRLAWRTPLALCIPCSLALVACPGDDSPSTPTDDGTSTSSAEDSTTAMSVDPTTSGSSSSTSTGMPSTTSGPGTTTNASTSTDAEESGLPTGEIAVCGNNVIEGEEVCDLNQLNGETCVSLGHQGGVLGCLLTCEDYNLLGCFICGNEVLDIAEDCEGGVVPEEVTCQSLGYEAGTVACGDDCLWDTSECSICGDGIQQGPENCDGIDFGGETCVSLGFDMGNLGCIQATCSFNFSGCEGGQYFQDFEAGLLPAEFTGGGTLPFVVDNDNAIAGMFSSHSGLITHNQTSSMSISANFGAAGDISFWHEESTEPCCDHLEFYIDGVMAQQWSGTNAAAMASFPVAAGMHSFEWRYDKDGSVNTGSDRVWVDDISMVPGVPI